MHHAPEVDADQTHWVGVDEFDRHGLGCMVNAFPYTPDDMAPIIDFATEIRSCMVNVISGVMPIKPEDAVENVRRWIAEAAQRHQVPAALLHALITIESVYDPNAVSRAGAVGLMQLMPATARRYGVYNRRDPTANLNAGTRYLKDLLTRFDNDVELALAGYNAGEKAVEKYDNQIPPYEETQEYVRKVLKLYAQESPTTAASVN